VEHSIAICAGESSGDLNGAHLAKAIANIEPGASLWGAGGPKMREAGVDVAVSMTGGGTIGIAESLKSLPAIAVKYHRMRWLLLKRRPDLFVPIDFGAFNIRLAQIARAHGIPVVYYFPPSSWRKQPRNSAKLIACGGKVVTPFPWSADLLSQAGVDARFVGHPLIDIVKPAVPREQFLGELGLSESMPTIGLLPGSRAHEIREHLACMIGCAEILHRDLGGAQFIVGAAWGAQRMRSQIAAMSVGKSDFPAIRVVEGRTYDCMAASDLLITASGTATLEAAIMGVPMVIIYRGSAIMRLEFAFRKSVLEDFIGMPNIVAGRGVCPELINDDVTPEKLADIARTLLTDGEALSEMKAELEEVRFRLGEPGAVDRAARAVLEMGELE
jgi:lipid-A-disaccharide synthase